MATLLAQIQVRPGREAEFENIVRTLYEHTLRTEPGCRRYEYWRGAKPQLYYCLLAFDDYHAFLAHQTSDHHEAASESFEEVIAELQLEWLDPVDGASDLERSDPQPLPENAHEALERAARWFGVQTQVWWHPLRNEP